MIPSVVGAVIDERFGRFSTFLEFPARKDRDGIGKWNPCHFHSGDPLRLDHQRLVLDKKLVRALQESNVILAFGETNFPVASGIDDFHRFAVLPQADANSGWIDSIRQFDLHRAIFRMKHETRQKDAQHQRDHRQSNSRHMTRPYALRLRLICRSDLSLRVWVRHDK